MRKIESKACNICKAVYSRRLGYSQKQWDATKYCSRECAHEYKRGRKLSLQSRQNMVAASIGRSSPGSGIYPRTKAHRANISKGLANMSPEVRKEWVRQIAEKVKGQKRSKESVEKMKEVWKSRAAYKGGAETEKMRKAFCQRRRDTRKKTSGGHTLEQWIEVKERFNNCCPNCGIHESQSKLTEDHIVPICKGGSDNIDNIQPLCFRCNSKKMTTPISYLPFPYGRI